LIYIIIFIIMSISESNLEYDFLCELPMNDMSLFVTFYDFLNFARQYGRTELYIAVHPSYCEYETHKDFNDNLKIIFPNAKSSFRSKNSDNKHILNRIMVGEYMIHKKLFKINENNPENYAYLSNYQFIQYHDEANHDESNEENNLSKIHIETIPINEIPFTTMYEYDGSENPILNKTNYDHHIKLQSIAILITQHQLHPEYVVFCYMQNIIHIPSYYVKNDALERVDQPRNDQPNYTRELMTAIPLIYFSPTINEENMSIFFPKDVCIALRKLMFSN
jgi:hypothetical protein